MRTNKEDLANGIKIIFGPEPGGNIGNRNFAKPGQVAKFDQEALLCSYFYITPGKEVIRVLCRAHRFISLIQPITAQYACYGYPAITLQIKEVNKTETILKIDNLKISDSLSISRIARVVRLFYFPKLLYNTMDSSKQTTDNKKLRIDKFCRLFSIVYFLFICI